MDLAALNAVAEAMVTPGKGILAADEQEVAGDRAGDIKGCCLHPVGTDRQQAAARDEIIDEDIGAHITQLGIAVEGRRDPVADGVAVHRAAGHVVVGRQDDFAIDDTGALRGIEAKIAAEQHTDRVSTGAGDAVDHVIVARPGARRAADIAVDRHHLAGRRRADRDHDVEQTIREAEIDHLARDIGMAAVDPRRAQHFDIGRDHREIGVFRRRKNLGAGIDLDTRGRSCGAGEGRNAALPECLR